MASKSGPLKKSTSLPDVDHRTKQLHKVVRKLGLHHPNRGTNLENIQKGDLIIPREAEEVDIEDPDIKDELGLNTPDQAIDIDNTDFTAIAEEDKNREELMQYRKNYKPVEPLQTDTYVESKVTGEFVKVKHFIPEEHTIATDTSRYSGREYDNDVERVVDGVNHVQGILHAFFLLCSGLVVGVAILQVYLVFLHDDDIHFLRYYSVFSRGCRQLFFILLSVCVPVSGWRWLLERNKEKIPLITYYQPKTHWLIWWRNIISLICYIIAYFVTLLNVGNDDYIDYRYQDNPVWFDSFGLTSSEESKLQHFYEIVMVRLLCVVIAWSLVVHRFAYAEYSYLQLNSQLVARPLFNKVRSSSQTGSKMNSSRADIRGSEIEMKEMRSSDVSRSVQYVR